MRKSLFLRALRNSTAAREMFGKHRDSLKLISDNLDENIAIRIANRNCSEDNLTEAVKAPGLSSNMTCLIEETVNPLVTANKG